VQIDVALSHALPFPKRKKSIAATRSLIRKIPVALLACSPARVWECIQAHTGRYYLAICLGTRPVSAPRPPPAAATSLAIQ
jgi:hypothetical protein